MLSITFFLFEMIVIFSIFCKSVTSFQPFGGVSSIFNYTFFSKNTTCHQIITYMERHHGTGFQRLTRFFFTRIISTVAFNHNTL